MLYFNVFSQSRHPVQNGHLVQIGYPVLTPIVRCNTDGARSAILETTVRVNKHN